MNKHIRLYFPGTGGQHPDQEIADLTKDNTHLSFLAFVYLKDTALKTTQPFQADDQSEARAYAGSQDSIYGSDMPVLASSVAEEIATLLSENTSLSIEITAMGFSRGGVCALILSELLSGFTKDRLKINLVLFDPVSGDQVKRRGSTSSSSAAATITNGKPLVEQCSDLSHCQPLNRVLCWYTSEDLPTMTGKMLLNSYFGTVVPTWPEGCEVTENVFPASHIGGILPGCYMELDDKQKMTGVVEQMFSTAIIYGCVMFLGQCDTSFSQLIYQFALDEEGFKRLAIENYEKCQENLSPTTHKKKCHASSFLKRANIVYQGSNKSYVNEDHATLADEANYSENLYSFVLKRSELKLGKTIDIRKLTPRVINHARMINFPERFKELCQGIQNSLSIFSRAGDKAVVLQQLLDKYQGENSSYSIGMVLRDFSILVGLVLQQNATLQLFPKAGLTGSSANQAESNQLANVDEQPRKETTTGKKLVELLNQASSPYLVFRLFLVDELRAAGHSIKESANPTYHDLELFVTEGDEASCAKYFGRTNRMLMFDHIRAEIAKGSSLLVDPSNNVTGNNSGSPSSGMV